MKKFTQAVWDFLVAWGEFRYEQCKKRQFRWY
jgi:hypothetical protein